MPRDLKSAVGIILDLLNVDSHRLSGKGKGRIISGVGDIVVKVRISREERLSVFGTALPEQLLRRGLAAKEP